MSKRGIVFLGVYNVEKAKVALRGFNYGILICWYRVGLVG